MKSLSVILFLILVTFASCKKESKTMINATVYLTDFPFPGDESRVRSNIAFLKGDALDIVASEESVTAFFESRPPRAAYYVDQYSEYVEDGTYTIVVQIADGLVSRMNTTYSYKTVQVRSGQETPSNVMVFKKSPLGYQPWNDKY